MDELEAVRRLLTQPPPGPEVVEAARANLGRVGVVPRDEAPVVHLNGGGHLVGGQPPARRHRWRGWLAPVAAAVAVIAVVAGSLAISGAISHHRRAVKTSGNAAAAVARAGVPRFFVALTGRALPDQGQHAEVMATATGAVLGSVTAPKPYNVFTAVAAAGDDRTFILAAQHGVPVSPRFPKLNGTGPAKLYKLVLHRSGKPGTLTALPVPPVTGTINGFALSPDASKLAVSVLSTVNASAPGKIEVLTLATGAVRTWTWPGPGFLGWDKPVARSLSWEADNRTLLFRTAGTKKAGAYLLDTSVPGGSLAAASKRIPIPSRELSGMVEGGLQISGPMLITGSGAKVVAPTSTTIAVRPGRFSRGSTKARELRDEIRLRNADVRKYLADHAPKQAVQRLERLLGQAMRAYSIATSPAYVTESAIAEFSVRTGKPVNVVDVHRLPLAQGGWTGVLWSGASGTSAIVVVPGPVVSGMAQPVVGVQDGATFTPLPLRLQRVFVTEQIAW
jgi:hypothetical protein